MGRPRGAEPCYTGGVASYSSLPQKARRQSSTASVRRSTVPMGPIPQAGLVFDRKGNLYGTTINGGIFNNFGCSDCGARGVVFKLTPKGKETVLYSFCSERQLHRLGGIPPQGRSPTKKGKPLWDGQTAGKA